MDLLSAAARVRVRIIMSIPHRHIRLLDMIINKDVIHDKMTNRLNYKKEQCSSGVMLI